MMGEANGFTMRHPTPGSEVQFGPVSVGQGRESNHSAPPGFGRGSGIIDTPRRPGENVGIGARRRTMPAPPSGVMPDHSQPGMNMQQANGGLQPLHMGNHTVQPPIATAPVNTQGGTYGFMPRPPFVPYAPRPVQYGHNTMNIKPDIYDGTGAWEDYLVQFEMVCIQNGWNEGTKALFLATYLRGKAREVLGDLDAVTRMNYGALCSVLEHRFGAGSQAELFKVQWKSRSRNKSENLPELSQAIRRLTKQAYPTAPADLQEMLAKDRFIDALDDMDIRWQVLQQNPDTLNEACRSAVQLEAYKVAERHRDRGDYRSLRSVSAETAKLSDSDMAMDMITKQLADLTEMVTSLQKKVNNNYHRSNENRSHKKCYICGDPTHLARACPQSTKEDQEKSDEKGSKSETSSVNLLARTGELSKSNVGLKVAVKLCNISVDFVIDTGADATFISSETYRSIPELIQPDLIPKTGMQIKLADGKLLPVKGQVKMKLMIDNKCYKQTVFVADINTDGILGSDFLRMYQCQIDFENNRIRIGEFNSGITSDKQNVRVLRVFSLHDLSPEKKEDNKENLTTQPNLHSSDMNCESRKDAEESSTNDQENSEVREISDKARERFHKNMYSYLSLGFNSIVRFWLLLVTFFKCFGATIIKLPKLKMKTSLLPTNGVNVGRTTIDNQICGYCDLSKRSDAITHIISTSGESYRGQKIGPSRKRNIKWRIPDNRLKDFCSY